MELLTYISQATKRRSRFEDLADDLIKEFPSLEKLEEEMTRRNHGLVTRLRYSKMRFSEFQRAVADDTLLAALAGVMMGRKSRKMTEATFATSTQALPYLWKFFADIQEALKLGRIKFEEMNYDESPNEYDGEIIPVGGGMVDIVTKKPTKKKKPTGASPTKYASRSIAYDDDLAQDIIDDMPTRLLEGSPGKAIPATWGGVEARTGRYIVTPIFGWNEYGQMGLKQEQGFREMIRYARLDKKCCEDCIGYAAQGWQPIGILPVPGQRCRCHDNCRCWTDYR